jgi:addiction module RelE/StbE family toxin
MRKIVLKKRFKKDVEKIKRTGRDMTRLAEVIDLLEQGKPLPPINLESAVGKRMRGASGVK